MRTTLRNSASARRSAALEAALEQDRRVLGERVAEGFRFFFLIVLAVLANFGGMVGSGSLALVDLLLGAWALVNLVVTLLLLRGHRPGRLFSLTTTAVDLGVGITLVYASNSFTSPYFLSLFVTIIAASVRFGTAASIISALVISVLYTALGGTIPIPDIAAHPQLGLEVLGRVILFLAVAVLTGVTAGELLRQRRTALTRAAELESVLGMTAAMASSLDPKEVFEIVLTQALEATGAASGVLLRKSRGGLIVAAATGPQEAAGFGSQLSAAAIEEVSSDSPVRMRDAGRQLLARINVDGSGTYAVILSGKRGGFTPADAIMVEMLGRAGATAIRNAFRYDESSREACTDGLTGLANRREFDRRFPEMLAAARHSERSLTLLLVDLDHFKQINDRLGHAQGDEALRAAARVVLESIRSTDLAARYGGDEIAIVLDGVDARSALSTTERLLCGIQEVRLTERAEVRLTFSIGVAAMPVDGYSPAQLLEAADSNLYRVKRLGRNGAAATTMAGPVPIAS